MTTILSPRPTIHRTPAASVLGLLLLLAAPAARAGSDPAGNGPGDFQRYAGMFAQKCAKCHTVGKGDRVGPDLLGVTRKRERAWLEGFIATPGRYLDSDPLARELLEKYNGVRMEDLGLGPQDVAGLIGYLEAVAESGGAAGDDLLPETARAPGSGVVGPAEGRRLLWSGMVLAVFLLAGAVAALRATRVGTAIACFGLAVLVGYGSLGGRRYHRLIGDDQGYEPRQPLAFSHAMHAGRLGIACLYCHHGAEKGPVAGVPSINVCMNCHAVVQKGERGTRPSPDLDALRSVWEKGRDDPAVRLEWVRVHDLPDFVTFDHRVHVKNGIACQQCHGPVQEMDVLRQAGDLSMGWCVNCHRQDEARVPSHWARASASLDCTTCHQ